MFSCLVFVTMGFIDMVIDNPSALAPVFYVRQTDCNKTYANASEELERRLIYEKARAFVNEHNMDNPDEYTLAMYRFNDLVNNPIYALSLRYSTSKSQTKTFLYR